MIGDVLARVGAGIVLGLALALVATRGLRALLFEVAPGDPRSLATAAVLLVLAGAAAALAPALRATRIDPVAALRWE